VLAVQSGLLDGMALPLVETFRRGLAEVLDSGAADAVRTIQEQGMLSETTKQSLLETLRQYLQTLASPSATAQAESA